jgi:hypothetical protein
MRVWWMWTASGCLIELPEDPGPGPETPTETGPTDLDGDGFAAPEDCDDAEPLVFPGAPELCNGLDDDCDEDTREVATVGERAFGDLQEALDAAEGEPVTVCAGIHPAQNLRVTRDSWLVGATGDPADVVLDGEGSGRILAVESGALTLEGLTLTRASTEEADRAAVSAGLPESGPLTVRGCVFEDNQAVAGAAAILARELVLEDSVFRDNLGQGQASTVLVEGQAPPGELVIARTTFEHNRGGLATLATNLATTVADSTFRGNEGGWQGMLNVYDSPSLTLQGSLFEGNQAGDGGAVLVERVPVVTVEDTLFTGNHAVATGGAARYEAPDGGVWSGGTFIGNVADVSGGGLSLSADGRSVVRDITAEGNDAPYGGGVLLQLNSLSVAVLEDSVVTGNTARVGGGVKHSGTAGGAFPSDGDGIELTRVVLEGNVASESGGGLAVASDSAQTVLTDCDLGEGPTDNAPDDLSIGGVSSSGYGAETSLSCTPDGVCQ